MTETEKSVLSKGLNFAATPPKLPVDDFIMATEQACQYIDSAPKAASLRHDVVKILSSKRPIRQNITLEERKALQTLSRNNEIKILPADKGRVTVLMNSNDYHTKISGLLTDELTYAKLKSDPTNTFKLKLTRLLKSWKDTNKISYPLWQKLYPTAAVIPKFYGLPKVHKINHPLRPIVSSVGSITYEAAKHLAKILGPLVGKTPYHVKNSNDFVDKIRDLEVPPPWKLVSFDVTALFTSIPINEALSVVREKLTTDNTWKDKTLLQANDILQLLDICLNTTYFVYQQQIYQQKQGAAMGSPVSPIIANLFMEDFERKALESSQRPPKIWYRYVDDTFTMMHQYDIEEFTQHLNNINNSIQFTHEEETDGTLPFLDIKVHILDDGTTKTSVYRKSTHTDQYLNFNSNHHLQHKRSVVRTLMHRAEKIVTWEEDRKKELKHVRKALIANEYKPWMLEIPKPRPQTNNTNREKKKNQAIALPFIKGISEPLERVFRKHDITVYHKPINTLRQQLVHPKDATPKEKRTGAIYQINCKDCDGVYIGETARALGVRVEEHKKMTSSAVHEHQRKTGHTMDWANTKILGREDTLIKRKVKEALAIRRAKPTLNRDQGWDLPPIFCSLVSHDLTIGSHVTN